MTQALKIEKLLGGWYRVSNGSYFSNVKRERTGKWSADIRRSNDGVLIQYAGIWITKREAIEEATSLLNSSRYS